MATNPMQRKARNSILIGIIIGLLIGGIIIAFLFMQLTKLQQQIKDTEAATRQAYVLKTDVKSGDKIDATMLVQKAVVQDVIPTDYVTVADITENTVAKVDLTKGSVLSKSLINEADEKMTSDLREQEYNMIVLPQYLEAGDYIDIRIRLEDGQDFIVISKKQVLNATEDTIWMNLYEQETLLMSNAIVEAYQMPGAKLYATTYVEPGNQTSASVTYVPSNGVIELINANPNITNEARTALASKYTDALKNKRAQSITSQLNAHIDDAQDNIEENVEQEITSSKDARKEYIDTLNASIE